jgi:hypothetical protein
MPDATGVAPQWQAIERVTAAEIHCAQQDNGAAATAVMQYISRAPVALPTYLVDNQALRNSQ